MLQGKSWIHFQGGKWNETPTDQAKSLLLVQRHKKKNTSLSLSVCVFPSPSNILCWDDGQNVGCKQHAGAACDVIWQISFRTNAKSGPKIVSSFSLFFFFSFCLVFVKPGDMGIELEGKKKKDFRIFESRSRRFCAPISDPVTTQTVYTCEKPIFDPTRV